MFDWDCFIGSLAFEALIAHWDNYAYDLSNYRLFHEPVSGKFTFLPWSTALDFGYRPWSYPDCGKYGVELSDYDDGILALRCEQSPTCHRAVVDRMESLADQWEALDPVGRVDELSDFVRDAVYDNPRRYYSTRDFEEHVECVRAWISQRPDEARAWVARERGG